YRRAADDSRALEYLLHDTRGLIPAASRRRRRDQSKLVDGGGRGGVGNGPACQQNDRREHPARASKRRHRSAFYAVELSEMTEATANHGETAQRRANGGNAMPVRPAIGRPTDRAAPQLTSPFEPLLAWD